MVESRPDLRPAFPGPRRRRRRRDPLVFSQDLPSLDPLQNYQPSLVTRVYSDDRQVIGQFSLSDAFSNHPRDAEEPDAGRDCHRGYAVFEHPGLDIVGILRATWTNLRHGGKKVEGASTITQQLARSLFLSAERTFDRKVRELILAYKMELVLTKEQILEMYLNQIYFGQGAYGSRGQSDLLRQRTFQAHAGRIGLPRRASQVTQPLFAVQSLRSGQEAAGTCAQPNGRGRVH